MPTRALLFLLLLLAPVLAWAVPGHYIVLHEDARGQVTVLSSTMVEMRDVRRIPATKDFKGHGGRDRRRLTVKALDGDRVVYETDVETANERRVESAGADGTISGRHAPLQEFTYVLRIPGGLKATRAQVFKPGDVLAAQAKRGSALPTAEINLAALPKRTLAKAGADVIQISATGDAANRVDLLILGDGYTASQRDKFVQDATNLAQRFFQASPYAEYRAMFNVVALFTPSNQSGASKPQCAETPGSTVVVADTALKAQYCVAGIRRLIGVDAMITFNTAAQYPDWDELMVLVNDPEYGGAGGAWSIASLDPSAIQIMQHEFGHSFSRLADEYPDPYPGYPACSDQPGTSNMPCEANVTDVLSPLKWAAYVTPGTAIPTTNPVPNDSRAAGAFEGARYQFSGMYRQCNVGLMRNLSFPFCKVDSAAFVDRLHSSGWGVPSAGISLIEPGTATPAAGVNAPAGSTVALRAKVVGPTQGVTATWLVDGTQVRQEILASGGTAALDHVVANGTHTVVLQVTDRSGISLTAHTSTTTWSVQASAAGSNTLRVTLAGSGSGRVVSDPPGIDCPAACTAGFASGVAVRLTATPASGSGFTGWTGACSGAVSCSLSVNATTDVTATFDPASAGALDVQPASIAFGGQSMHTSSPALNVTIRNTGTTTITVSGISTAGSFAATSDCAQLAAGATCTARVAFTPATEGAITGTLDVATSAGNRSIALGGTGERSLVTHYYRSILRRAPDDGGKTFWNGEAARMQALGANANEAWFAMSAAFFASAEYAALARDDAGFVQDLYTTFFNRAADANGSAYWVGQLQSGLPRPVALSTFMFSEEFRQFAVAIFGNTSVRKEIDTVTDFYRGLLGRLPDDGGFTAWRDRFRAAQCSGASAVANEANAISSQFAGGPEYAGRNRSDALFVGDLYNAFLRRGGDLDGVRYWIDQLSSGARTRDQVRAQFFSSSEFQSRITAMVNEGCLAGR